MDHAIWFGLAPAPAEEIAGPLTHCATQRASTRKSLYASVWHCSDCVKSVRVYSTLEQVVFGMVDSTCPGCCRPMTPEAHQERANSAEPQATCRTGATLHRKATASAWAA